MICFYFIQVKLYSACSLIYYKCRFKYCCCWSSLDVQKKSSRVFDKFLNSNQECDSFTAINKSVIISKGDIHHRTDFNLDHGWLSDKFLLQLLLYFTFPLTAIGLSLIACIPKMAVWGKLIIGVPINEPNTPPLEIVKVPPAMSSMVILLSRAWR